MPAPETDYPLTTTLATRVEFAALGERSDSVAVQSLSTAVAVAAYSSFSTMGERALTVAVKPLATTITISP